MSTEFNYNNFGSKMVGEPENKFGMGYFENDSDSDGENNYNFYNNFKQNSMKSYQPNNINSFKEGKDQE